MKRVSTLVLSVLGSLAVTLTATGPPGPCGPGAHWVDACSGGSGDVPVSCTTLMLDTDFDGSADMQLDLDGPSTVMTSDPIDDSVQFPGTAPIDGHLDVLDTAFVSLVHTDGSATMIAGQGQGAGPRGPLLQASWGAVFEVPEYPELAVNFADMFVEIDLDGDFLYNDEPLRLQTTIDQGPPLPGTVYPALNGVDLFASPYPGPMEQPIAAIVDATLVFGQVCSTGPVPTITTFGLVSLVLMILTAAVLLLRRSREGECPGSASMP